MKCGKPIASDEEEYCSDCEDRFLAFDEGKSLWVHAGSVAQAVYRFKFHNRRCYADVFADLMADRYGEWVRKRQIDLLIPVPLFPSRKIQRGFNQAELMARKLSQDLEIPMRDDVVLRVKKTKPQKTLNAQERDANLREAFGVRRDWIPCRRALIIDDIYTTGNTVHHMAKVLKKAGVEKVYFLTVSIGQGT